MYTNSKQIFIDFITCDIKQDRNIHKKVTKSQISKIWNIDIRMNTYSGSYLALGHLRTYISYRDLTSDGHVRARREKQMKSVKSYLRKTVIF